MKYWKFGAMLTLSFIQMYLVMFLNVDDFDHVMNSLTRVYMSALMVLPMAVIMIAFMGSMYGNKKANAAIVVGAVAGFCLILWMLRKQVPIGDEQWMKAMIPHHSSAIMVSQQADLSDPEAQKLAKEIIEAQEREIAQMETILYRLEAGE